MAFPIPIATDIVTARASVRALPTDQTSTDQTDITAVKTVTKIENGVEITVNDERRRNLPCL
jgi:hypothetical protein